MTDNVVTSPPSGPGGATIACDDIGGVQHQRVKLVLGNDGVSDGDVSTTNPMPVLGEVTINPLPPSRTYIRRFGLNNTVGTTHELIDTIGATAPYMPSSPVTIEAVSTSAADANPGAGAHTIRIHGLDAGFNLKTVDLNLAGTTPVVDSQFIRVTKVEVLTVGTYGGSNLGDITVRAVGGTAFVLVPAGYGQSFSSHFCVPAGYVGHVAGANLSIDAGKTVDILVRARDNANLASSPFGATQIVQFFAGLSGVSHYDYEMPIEVGPYTDVWITGAVASGSAQVSVEYWGYMHPIA